MGMWPLKTILFLASFLAACGISLYYPIVGLVNYIVLYQLMPWDRWWGRPLDELGIRYSLWAAMAMTLGVILNWHTRRMPRPHRFLNAWEVVAILLVLVAVIGHFAIGPGEPGRALMLDKFCKMIFFVLCLTHLVSTRRYVMVVWWALALGTLQLGYDAFTAPSGEFVRGRLEAIGGTDFHHSSGFAAHLAAMLPLLGALCFVTRRWWCRLIPMLSGVLAFNAIVLCRTRSAFVGLLAGTATAVLLVPKSWRWRTYLTLVVVLVGAYALTDGGWWNRMNTIRDPEIAEQDAAVNLRLAVWHAGSRMVGDHPWGVGIGAFEQRIGEWDPWVRHRAAHNTLLLCTAELGIPGLALFLGLVALSFRQLAAVHRMADRSDDPPATRMLVYGALISLVVYLVASMFTDRLYTESYWWILALPVCLHRAVAREVAAGQTEPDFLTPLDEEPADEWMPVPRHA
jgi:putative inorganic carbon (HCO3(-)) transporter